MMNVCIYIYFKYIYIYYYIYYYIYLLFILNKYIYIYVHIYIYYWINFGIPVRSIKHIGRICRQRPQDRKIWRSPKCWFLIMFYQRCSWIAMESTNSCWSTTKDLSSMLFFWVWQHPSGATCLLHPWRSCLLQCDPDQRGSNHDDWYAWTTGESYHYPRRCALWLEHLDSAEALSWIFFFKVGGRDGRLHGNDGSGGKNIQKDIQAS